MRRPRFHQRFPATVALIVALLAVFGLQWALGGTMDLRALTRMGALRADRVGEHGEFFRLFLGTWLHFGPLHLALNLVALAQLASLVEYVWGASRMLLIFLVSGLMAALVTASFGDYGRPAVGASGGVMGLAGLLLAARTVGDPSLRLFLEEVLGRRLMVSVIVTFVVGLVLELFMPMVDNYGHLGGFLAGAALALVFPEPDSSPAPTRVGLTMMGLMLGGSVLVAVQRGGDALGTLDRDVALQVERSIDASGGGWATAAMLPELVDRYAAAGDPGRGREVFARTLERMTDSTPVMVVAGGLLERPERDAEAALALERWLVLAPHDALALNAVAWFLVTRSEVSLRDPSRAEALASKALRRIESPESEDGRAQRAAVLDTRAEALFLLGRFDEAQAAQAESVALARELELTDLPAMEDRLAKIEAARP